MVDDNDIFLIEEYEKTSHPENGMFSISDESGILKILSEFQDYLPPLKNGEYRKSAAEKLSKYACCILLRKDYVNVGFAAIYANDKETKTGFIPFIAVSEHFRKRNYGTLLLDTLIRIAKDNQMEQIKLEVYKSNTNAQIFYLKNGYQYLTDGDNDSVFMIKKIDYSK